MLVPLAHNPHLTDALLASRFPSSDESAVSDLRYRVRLVLVGMIVLCTCAPAAGAQSLAKYGAEFLAGGTGARALGMGGAYVALAEDVTAGYWNPAGLGATQYPEIAYMHVERFAGVVSFDYAGGSFPVSRASTIGLSLFRSGVNDIVNTLGAWNAELGQPVAGYRSRITRFSAADYAFMLSYARTVRAAAAGDLTLGVTGKMVRRTIGDFAGAWGYSFDAGVRYRRGRLMLGATVQDLPSLFQSWSVNPAAFEVDCTDEDGETYDACIDPETGAPYESNAARYEALFDQRLPEGGTEVTLPVARLGAGYTAALGAAGADGEAPGRLTLGLGLDVRFDGQRAYAPNVGDVSLHPRLGAELSYRSVVALRAGISRVQVGDGLGLSVTPTVGAGLRLKQVHVDYSFGDFAGATADLGFSHRISARLRLEQPGLKRAE